jgi:glycine/D-amino acid oxidase-like deaminating enzyme/nitrite reductase/ring-hydroxylating ferredoxin subunit
MIADPDSNVSYWVSSMPIPLFPTLEDEVSVDVAIVGGGIVGITAATVLKREGKRVALLEKDRVLHGVTGYTTAKVTSGHNLIYQKLEDKHGADVARAYAAANEGALNQIVRWVEEERIDCDLERKANYVYSEDPRQLDAIRAEIESAERAGLPATFTDKTTLPFPVAGAVELADQAQFHPLKYLSHFVAQIPTEGSHVFENTRVTHVSERGEGCEALTENGRVVADAVIVATNYPFIDRGLFFARVHPKRSYCVAGLIPRDRAPDGMFISCDEPTRSVRTIRDGDGLLLLLGGNGHSVGRNYETEEQYGDLEGWLSERFGIDHVTHRWSTQDGVTIDLIPYVGTARRTSKRTFVATGFGKWGMTNGTAAALLLADLILGRDNEFAGLYDPHRLTPRASAVTFVKENIDIGLHFTLDRLRHPQHRSFDSLEPGEAAVNRVGLQQVAGYRDPSGKMHLVSAQCTHLGCIVTWNEAERSWDCPCHGSRFDPDGRVLHGPATRDLQNKDSSTP